LRSFCKEVFLLRVGVGGGELVYAAVLLDNVKQAPVRELGDHEACDPLQRLLVVSEVESVGPAAARRARRCRAATASARASCSLTSSRSRSSSAFLRSLMFSTTAMKYPAPRRVAHERHREVHPNLGIVFFYVAFLYGVRVELARENPLRSFEVFL
jgi:hypothetical protein